MPYVVNAINLAVYIAEHGIGCTWPDPASVGDFYSVAASGSLAGRPDLVTMPVIGGVGPEVFLVAS